MIVRNKYAYYIRIIVSAAVVLCSFFPIFWLVNSSLKPFELLTNGEVLAPIGQLNLEGYKRALEDSTFWLYVKNSIIVGLISTFFVIILSLAGAYSLARMKFPGRSFISSTVLFVYMVPPVLLAIPIYMWMYKLGFLNTRTGVIFGHISRSLPFALWMMKGFFKGLPQDIEDAARIDGCNLFQILTKIILPLSGNGIVSVATYTLITSWNDYIMSYMLITKSKYQTLPVGLSIMYDSSEFLDIQGIMASSVLSALPVIIFFFCLQKYLVKGIASGSVKG